KGLSALSRQLINAFSSKGLLRKPTAPAFIARLWNLSSGKAVMKITGTQWPSTMSRLCRSRPERPGICRSVIRHEVSARHAASRNRSADSKVATSYPSDSIRSRSDSLAKSSSSTIEIMGFSQIYYPLSDLDSFAQRSRHHSSGRRCKEATTRLRLLQKDLP